MLPSLAPSMDIQVASNFERLLYYWVDQERGGEGVSEKVVSWMKQLRTTRLIDLPSPDSLGFSSTATLDKEIPSLIKKVYKKDGYVVDPHTACGFSWAPKEGEQTVVLATAHPAKFPDTIREAIGVDAIHPSLEKLKGREMVKYSVEATEESIRNFVRERVPG